MKVGVSGTEYGMTPAQKQTFRNFLDYPGIVELHHGDCVGADAEMHDLTVEVNAVRVADNYNPIKIVVHPPLVTSKQAFKLGHEARNPRDYLQRNRNIVDETSVLVACPRGARETNRGGTWYTVRYARRQGKQVWLILPSGEILD